MKYLAFALLLSLMMGLVSCAATPELSSEEGAAKESWWKNFKERVKVVLSKWRDDLRVLWDDVLSKAEDMKGWTTEVLHSFKMKIKEWVDKRPEVPDDEKNEINNFIEKLKLPTERPIEKVHIDP